jgi:CMP-N,N'-diacetyllegionaminic acid synthase
MSKIIAFIPARSGSKRIKNKNIIEIKKKPLLGYSIIEAKKSKIFDRVIVITDSMKYKKIAERYGAEVPFLRPKKTAMDHSPDLTWLKWIVRKLNLNNDDIFSILRPTNPFRKASTIKRAWKLFKINKRKIDSIRAVEICKQHPGKMWIFKNSKIVPLIKKKINGIPYHSNQYKVLPKIYIQNASLEISFVKNITEKNSISGNRILPFFTKNLEGLDINNKEDLILAKLHTSYL